MSLQNQSSTEQAELLAQLRSPDPDQRQLALIALEEVVDGRAVEALIGSTRDEDATVRRLAIERLEDLGDGRAAAALVEALEDGDETVRLAAARALRELRSETAVGPLLEAVSHPSALVRQAAIVALRDLRDERGSRHLEFALADVDPGVRREAVISLAHLRRRDSLPALRARQEDPDAQVRRLVVGALAALAGTGADEPAAALALISDAGSRALRDEDWQVRREGAIVLGRAGAVDTLPALRARLGDAHWQVSKEAAAALGKIGVRSPEICAELGRLLDSPIPDVRKAAAASLGDLGGADTVGALAALERDPDSDVRKTSLRALAALRARLASGGRDAN
jgi:HEAT repeat protein